MLTRRDAFGLAVHASQGPPSAGMIPWSGGEAHTDSGRPAANVAVVYSCGPSHGAIRDSSAKGKDVPCPA
eukprot:CAMPEP_0197893456 /NCGR_PEP_ID=MMETSP1439-20131203/32768_1 /TAXON_ID=66791 /ORGANISM="Gonyaulax spinifera, Strain CCMP409" /LENGTH=69 /DNA_ID=CAMNT_0043513723 /DNA_START=83 /DNA_END=292 /DNA_ORIENTATION=-